MRWSRPAFQFNFRSHSSSFFFLFEVQSIKMNNGTPEIIPTAKVTKLEIGEPSFFLDSIPKEVLENVLRYFSRLPNSKKWETYIDVRNIAAAFWVTGGFGTLLKSRFHTFLVSRTKSCDGYETVKTLIRWK